MGFQDVVFLPSRASFFTTILTNCGIGESLWTNTCHKTLVGGKQWHSPSKILFLQESPFFVSVESCGGHKTVKRSGKVWPPTVLWILPDLKRWCVSLSQHHLFSCSACSSLLCIASQTINCQFCCKPSCRPFIDNTASLMPRSGRASNMQKNVPTVTLFSMLH